MPAKPVRLRWARASTSPGPAQTRPNVQLVKGSYKTRDYKYWLPLLAAYSGCRPNELTQLRLEDVVQHDSSLALRITDASEDQSLKTKALRALGTTASIAARAWFCGLRGRAQGARTRRVVFWDTPKRNGRRSEAAGKWFRKLLVRLGIKTSLERGGIHRSRHTVVQKPRDAGHSDAEIALIVGHETRLAPMTVGYGSSRIGLLQQQRAMLEALSYEGLDQAIPNLSDP